MKRRIAPALAALLRDESRGTDFTAYHARDYTGVVRVPLPCVRPYDAQVFEPPGWRTIGSADTYAAAESLARCYRIDHRGRRTRISEQPRPVGGFAYMAV